jgi:hypothetical protein
VARWRKAPEAQAVPAWVLETDPADPLWPVVEAWLDELRDRDPAACEAAITEMLSAPSYTRPR